jgi:phospholipid transport system substrate-binding protein
MAAGALAAAGPWPALAQAEDPAARIKSFYDALQAVTAGPQASDPKARFAALQEPVGNAFDLTAMARLAIGPQWSKFPAAKQASLQEAFGRYFVATYANRLGGISGARFEVTPNAEPRTGGRLVRTKVIDAGGRETPVDYLVGPEGKVVDLYLSGTVSELAALRAQFDPVLKSGGPDRLEAYLRERADKALGGA